MRTSHNLFQLAYSIKESAHRSPTSSVDSPALEHWAKRGFFTSQPYVAFHLAKTCTACILPFVPTGKIPALRALFFASSNLLTFFGNLLQVKDAQCKHLDGRTKSSHRFHPSREVVLWHDSPTYEFFSIVCPDILSKLCFVPTVCYHCTIIHIDSLEAVISQLFSHQFISNSK